MNLAAALTASAKKLADASIPQPRREAATLLAFTLNRDRTFLIAHPEYELTPVEENAFSVNISRRADRVPFHHIVGVKEFYGLDFQVTPDTLIPRPETEILVEQAITRLRALDSPHFCEIGVGCGCVSVSILHNLPSATATAIDICRPALDVARRNAIFHSVNDRIRWMLSDIFSDLADEKFDGILSNPPYIPYAEIAELEPEVRDHEPHSALTDGGDGLSIIEQIICNSPDFLRSGGYLMIEIGFGQAASVKQMFANETWRSVEFFNDFQTIPRTVVGILR